MAHEALERIKEAEKQAASTIKEAENFSQTKILDTKLQAKEKVRWAETEARAEARDIITKARHALSVELDKIAKITHKEEGELRKRASENLPKAVDFTVKELLKNYGCSKIK